MQTRCVFEAQVELISKTKPTLYFCPLHFFHALRILAGHHRSYDVNMVYNTPTSKKTCCVILISDENG